MSQSKITVTQLNNAKKLSAEMNAILQNLGDEKNREFIENFDFDGYKTCMFGVMRRGCPSFKVDDPEITSEEINGALLDLFGEEFRRVVFYDSPNNEKCSTYSLAQHVAAMDRYISTLIPQFEIEGQKDFVNNIDCALSFINDVKSLSDDVSKAIGEVNEAYKKALKAIEKYESVRAELPDNISMAVGNAPDYRTTLKGIIQ